MLQPTKAPTVFRSPDLLHSGRNEGDSVSGSKRRERLSESRLAAGLREWFEGAVPLAGVPLRNGVERVCVHAQSLSPGRSDHAHWYPLTGAFHAGGCHPRQMPLGLL